MARCPQGPKAPGGPSRPQPSATAPKADEHSRSVFRFHLTYDLLCSSKAPPPGHWRQGRAWLGPGWDADCASAPTVAEARRCGSDGRPWPRAAAFRLGTLDRGNNESATPQHPGYLLMLRGVSEGAQSMTLRAEACKVCAGSAGVQGSTSRMASRFCALTCAKLGLSSSI